MGPWIFVNNGYHNNLLTDEPQAISWSNSYLSSTGPLETHFNEILSEIQENAFERVISKKPFMCWDKNIPGELGWYYGYWCPGPYCRQAVNSHDIDYAE